MKRYIVRLKEEERAELHSLVSKGKTAAYRIRHANILLAVDAAGPAWTDEDAAQALGCNTNTIRNVRQRFVEQGLVAALERKKQDKPSRQQVFDGEKEAYLIATACSEAPGGRSYWTMQLLANKLVELRIVDTVSPETVRRTLKKTL